MYPFHRSTNLTTSPTPPAVPRLGDSWWISSAAGSYIVRRPSGGGAQAVVDVVQVDAECLVEAVEQLEDVAPRGQAGTGHGRALARRRRHAQVPGSSLGRPPRTCPAAPVSPTTRPQCCRRPIRIEEPGPCGGDVGSERLGAEWRQPIALARLDVVVEEQQDVAPGNCCPGVVERRPIERPRVAEHPDIGSVGQPFHQGERLGVGGSVVDRARARRSCAGQSSRRSSRRRCEGGAARPGTESGCSPGSRPWRFEQCGRRLATRPATTTASSRLRSSASCTWSIEVGPSSGSAHPTGGTGPRGCGSPRPPPRSRPVRTRARERPSRPPAAGEAGPPRRPPWREAGRRRRWRAGIRGRSRASAGGSRTCHRPTARPRRRRPRPTA